MKYQKLNRFSDSEFQRLVGVPRPVFSEMVEVLKEAESLKKKSGHPHTLVIEDQLLLTLNYLRNYSTQLELAANYHIAESNVNRTIKKVEDALMKSRLLPYQNEALPQQTNNLTGSLLMLQNVQ